MRLCSFSLYEKLNILDEAEVTQNHTMTRKFEVSESSSHYKTAVTGRLFISKKGKFTMPEKKFSLHLNETSLAMQ
jgi:hypothetical protein